MKFYKLLIDFGLTFVVTLLVAVMVTFLWNLAFESAGVVDWATSVRLALILGFVLPVAAEWERRKTPK